ncbi:hypothetical protein [Candidatus Methylomicrobium oryzae]|jgi:hypothetical protein|uniref:hypothetical protein n=1 Tax=Candidatus Methylomicrobium oryzae TaxID=2802053 RepID=UPI00192241F7|nr:hypothetical protein [Methylomicrobium sp. RS1]MBL1265736.1 hypothetical protein [Methylomicrobium sp. RS1]
MVEPVALSDFFIGFFSGALIILLAALYAALFAWEKLQGGAGFRYGSWLAYGLLLACAAVFAKVLHLEGHWKILTVLMVVGYWWMPRLIWRLCAATHAHESGR